LIIAILIAIAIPTFLGARTRAQDRAAQSEVRNGYTAEKTVYTDAQTFSSDVSVGGQMRSVEPSLKWGTTVTVGVGNVLAGDKGVVCLGETSKSGTAFNLADVSSGPNMGTFFNKGGNCSDLTPTTLSGSAWNTGW
jgi:type IV pilus assembly protein PilA